MYDVVRSRGACREGVCVCVKGVVREEVHSMALDENSEWEKGRNDWDVTRESAQ